MHTNNFRWLAAVIALVVAVCAWSYASGTTYMSVIRDPAEGESIEPEGFEVPRYGRGSFVRHFQRMPQVQLVRECSYRVYDNGVFRQRMPDMGTCVVRYSRDE